jgi:hypothetical protein
MLRNEAKKTICRCQYSLEKQPIDNYERSFIDLHPYDRYQGKLSLP